MRARASGGRGSDSPLYSLLLLLVDFRFLSCPATMTAAATAASCMPHIRALHAPPPPPPPARLPMPQVQRSAKFHSFLTSSRSHLLANNAKVKPSPPASHFITQAEDRGTRRGSLPLRSLSLWYLIFMRSA